MDAVGSCPLDGLLQQRSADAAALGRLRLQVRHVRVALALADRVRHFLNQVDPDLADGSFGGTVLPLSNRDPRAPAIAGELAPHPPGAPLDERVVSLDRAIASGAKFPAQFGQCDRIGCGRGADLDHEWCSRRNSAAARATSSDHSWPPANSSGRTWTLASRRR